MKIDAKTLYEFVNKVTIGGVIPQCVLEGISDGLVCKLKTSDAIGASSGLLKAGVFTTPPTNEVLGFNDSKKLLSALKTFDGEVEVTTKDNVITLSNTNKVVSIIKATPEFIDNHMPQELPLFSKFVTGFDLQTQHLRNIRANKEIASSDDVLFEVKDKTLRLVVGQDNFDKVEDIIHGIDYKDCSGRYPEVFEQIIAQCGNLIKVSMIEEHLHNGPIGLSESNEKMHLKWLVAPRATEETNTEAQ